MEISKETGLPYPTTFRIVQTLIHEGVVEQEPSRKRYRATALVQSLSSGFQEDDRLLGAAAFPMEEFTATYHWPVALAVRVGNRMMVKHSTSHLTSQTFVNHHPGDNMPLLDCSSGRVYLAFCDQKEREIVLEGIERHSSGHNTMSWQLVTEGGLLQTVQEDGYAAVARTPFNRTPGKTSAFSVPLLHDGKLVACMTFVFFATAHSIQDAIDQYLEPVKALARTVSERIQPE